MRTRTLSKISIAHYHEEWRVRAHNKNGICFKFWRAERTGTRPVREYYPSPGLAKMIDKWLPCFVATCDFSIMAMRGGNRITIKRKDEKSTE